MMKRQILTTMYLQIPISWLCSTFVILNLLVTTFAQTPIAYHAVERVKEGGMLSFICEIKNFQLGNDIVVSRRTIGQEIFTKLTTNNHIRQDIHDDRMFVAERQSNDDKSYLFSIVDVERNRDEGVYKCQTFMHDDTVLSSPEVTIRVEHFPESTPECTPSGPVQVREGQLARFNCSSEIGHPPVTLSWNRDQADTKQITNNVYTYKVLETTFTFGESNTLLICEVISSSFPEDARRVCQIGPIVVWISYNYNWTDLTHSTNIFWKT